MNETPETMTEMRTFMESLRTADPDGADDCTWEAWQWLQNHPTDDLDGMSAGIAIMETFDLAVCADCGRPITYDEATPKVNGSVGGHRHLEAGVSCFLHAAWVSM